VATNFARLYGENSSVVELNDGIFSEIREGRSLLENVSEQYPGGRYPSQLGDYG
jgi:hypothetical protein